MRLQPKNWAKFQHYKHRNPPWIKLHRDLLDDADFSNLPDASAMLAIRLWLLAASHPDGIIDNTERQIAFRLRITTEKFYEDISPLISSGFIVCLSDDDKMLAPCMQHATPETEAETETETETAPGEKKPRQRIPTAYTEGADHATFVRWWCFAFHAVLRNKYKMSSKDTKIVKNLLASSESVKEMVARAAHFLTVEDQWLENKGRDLPMLSNYWNRLPHSADIDFEVAREYGIVPPKGTLFAEWNWEKEEHNPQPTKGNGHDDHSQ